MFVVAVRERISDLNCNKFILKNFRFPKKGNIREAKKDY